jgi:hypothetical protein
MLTFKKYKQLTEMSDEQIMQLTEEQLDEIFSGIFGTSKKLEDEAAKKRAALKLAQDDRAKKEKEKRRADDKLMAKTASALRDKEYAHNGGFNPLERGSLTMRSQAAKGRASELDWVRNALPESADVQSTFAAICEGQIPVYQILHEPAGQAQRQIAFALKEAERRFNKSAEEIVDITSK